MAQLLQTSFLPSSFSFLRRTQNTHILRISTSKTQVNAKIREIFMPALSSTMTEGKIVSWVKSEGDKLSKGESVVVVESDKADMDVETFYDGYLAKIMVDEGGVATVGSAIALLAETEDEIAEAQAKAAASPSSETSSTASAVTTAPATEPQPEKVKVVESARPAAVPVGSAAHPASEGGKRIVASPYAKKLAKELKVELAGLVGSGPVGRIVAKDVEAAAAAAFASLPAAVPVAAATAGIELGSVVPFTTMQAAVGRNMVQSLTVPTFRVGYTITTDSLDALYKKVRIFPSTNNYLLLSFMLHWIPERISIAMLLTC